MLVQATGILHTPQRAAPARPPHTNDNTQVWDLKTGQLQRIQTVHRGMVTCLAYAPHAKLLFSGSIDGSIGVWTDKGALLQVGWWGCELQRQSCPARAAMMDSDHHTPCAHHAAQVVPTGWPVFSLAWGGRQRMLVAGGNSVLHIFRLEMADVLRAKHAAASVDGHHGFTGATSGGAWRKWCRALMSLRQQGIRQSVLLQEPPPPPYTQMRPRSCGACAQRSRAGSSSKRAAATRLQQAAAVPRAAA